MEGRTRTGITMRGEMIEAVKEERDLGIWMEEALKPNKHCAAAAKAANFALGQLLRGFHYRKKSNLIPLYKTFVRPRLEFAAGAWSPWTETGCKELERVQERLMRAIPDVRGTTHEERLRDAGLSTLRERRERGDAIEAFKTLKRINKVDKEKWFAVVGPEARATRANSEVGEEGEVRRTMVVEVQRANLEVRRNAFCIRAAKTWNGLPEKVKNTETVTSFKAAYDSWKTKTKREERPTTTTNAMGGVIGPIDTGGNGIAVT